MENNKKKSVSQFKQIVDGYSNLVKSKLGLSSEEARREICNSCPERSAMDRCLMCGCPLAAKTRSLQTNCPKHNW